MFEIIFACIGITTYVIFNAKLKLILYNARFKNINNNEIYGDL